MERDRRASLIFVVMLCLSDFVRYILYKFVVSKEDAAISNGEFPFQKGKPCQKIWRTPCEKIEIIVC